MALPPNPLQKLHSARIAHVRNLLRSRRWDAGVELPVRGGPVNDDFLPLAAAKRQRFRRVEPGEAFGPDGGGWLQRWFRLDLPRARKAERGRRALHWDCDGEATAWMAGRPWAGLDPGHPYCVLPDGGGELWIDAGLYQTALNCPGGGPIRGRPCRFRAARLRLRDEDAWRAYHDIDVLFDLLSTLLADHGLRPASCMGYTEDLGEVPPTVRFLLEELTRACDAYDRHGMAACGRRLRRIYAELPSGALDGRLACVGHGHLDLVWKWPERVTRQKAVHTAATMLRLMERYPEFRFLQSQPPFYDMIGARAPALAREIRGRIDEGRWLAGGAMEVEADNLIPCGEALARNLLIGRERLAGLRGGDPSRLLWLPDVFGYATCLPQLLRQVGVPYFFTSKIAWSQVTRFPHSAFRWRGADGSEVAAFLLTSFYSGGATPREMIRIMRQQQQAGVFPEGIAPVGHGDGGGGTTEEMCERVRRLGDLAGVPRCVWEDPEAFMERLVERADELPVHEGELYLELHRGTYTAQGRFKLACRRAERILLAREAAAVMTGCRGPDPAAWRRLVFTQFHDAIPGSSIAEVYAELGVEMRSLVEGEEAALAKALAGRGRGAPLLANPHPLDRLLTVELPSRELPAALRRAGGWRSGDGVHGRLQPGHRRGTWLVRAPVPALGTRAVAGGAWRPEPIVADPRRLDNGRLRADFDSHGHLRRFEVDGVRLAVEHADLVLYADNPYGHPAWDIDRSALDCGRLLRARLGLAVEENGPVRAVLAGGMEFGAASRLAIRYVLQADSDVLEIEMEVDWREREQLLKYHLRTGYRGEQVICGAPFGAVRRSHKHGPEAAEAQFEMPFSRWLAVADDAGEGLAVLTEAKYGASVRDGDVGLSLLRAPRAPDPEADQGPNRIRFAVGPWRPAAAGADPSTPAAADALYAPVATGRRRVEPPFAWVDRGSLVPVATKPADDGDGFVLRCHETAGDRGRARLRLRVGLRAELTDLREGAGRHLAASRTGLVRIPYRPYQVVSVRIGEEQR